MLPLAKYFPLAAIHNYGRLRHIDLANRPFLLASGLHLQSVMNGHCPSKTPKFLNHC